MKWQELKTEPCSVARTLSVIGEKWTILILRDCYRGLTRFDAFEKSLGIPRALLSERLKRMVIEEILIKQADPNHAKRFDYILTQKGWDLRAVTLTMMAWGNKYMSQTVAPMEIRHLNCNHMITPELHCPVCAKKLDPKEIEVSAKNQ